MYTIKDMYDLDHTLAKDYLSQFTYPWEALKGIKDFILQLGPTLDPEEYEEVKMPDYYSMKCEADWYYVYHYKLFLSFP